MGDKQSCQTSPPPYCSPHNIQEWENNFALVNEINIVVSFISIVASLLIILTYFCLNVIRIPSFRVIMLLVFSDLCFSIQTLFLWEDPNQLYNKPLCIGQAFFSNWSNMSQLGWTTVMALILYFENRYYMLALDIFSRKKVIMYAMIGAVVPLLLSLLPFFDAYSPNQYFCWITIKKESITLCNPLYFQKYNDFCFEHNEFFAIILYTAVWLSIVFNVVVYIRIIWLRRKNYKQFRDSVQTHQSNQDTTSLHLLIFPLGQLVIWVIPTLHRISNLISPTAGQPVFSILHYCSISASGIVNMFIYGCNPLVRAQVKAILSKQQNPRQDSNIQPLIQLTHGASKAEYDSD